MNRPANPPSRQRKKSVSHSAKKKDRNFGTIDIVIPVMGPTGVGKSTFINALLKANDKPMEVGHKLTSCTKDLQVSIIDPLPAYPNLNLRDTRLVVVDTPGFDDTYEGDAATLTKIARWLEQSYRDPTKVLGGVIYLHDISQNRFTGTTRRNFEMFKHLCGHDAFHKVILGTTMWGRTPLEIGTSHERELSETHWKSLTEKGSKVLQFAGNAQSAWSFISAIVLRHQLHLLDQSALQIQKELTDEKKILPETAAGKELRYTLREVLEVQKQIASMEKSMASEEDAEAQAKIQERLKTMQELIHQITELKIPLARRLTRFFRFI